MSVNVYEGLFILDANEYARDPAGTVAEVEKLFAEQGAELLASRLWEERRLAYPIKKQHKGVYWLTYFRTEGSRMAELNRQARLNERFLRHMFIKIDPRIADHLVAVARGEAPPEEAPVEVVSPEGETSQEASAEE